MTGGCGFIGSNFVLEWLALENEPVVVIDKLTYAGNFSNLKSIENHPQFIFIKGDINDRELIESLLIKYRPRALINFAAESHVDRSINKPDEFILTNINGSFTLLETARNYWSKLQNAEQIAFRFLQISTDEVYGALKEAEAPFNEDHPYSPRNPYSASKAAADHLVKAYFHTYGLPVLITNCSNNYGPYQFPEKLIPFVILNALEGKPLLLYGDGLQIRDWLYVTDHCDAIRKVLKDGILGETYNIGGHCEKTNLDVVKTICATLDNIQPNSQLNSYSSLITHIADRPGHDRRYAIDANKIKVQLGWQPKESFNSGIHKTTLWYLNNLPWINSIKIKENYQDWLAVNYHKERVT